MAIDVMRAWKDPEYRKTLSAEELASLPKNPAGKSDLSEGDLDNISGGQCKGSSPDGVRPLR